MTPNTILMTPNTDPLLHYPEYDIDPSAIEGDQALASTLIEMGRITERYSDLLKQIYSKYRECRQDLKEAVEKNQAAQSEMKVLHHNCRTLDEKYQAEAKNRTMIELTYKEMLDKRNTEYTKLLNDYNEQTIIIRDLKKKLKTKR